MEDSQQHQRSTDLDEQKRSLSYLGDKMIHVIRYYNPKTCPQLIHKLNSASRSNSPTPSQRGTDHSFSLCNMTMSNSQHSGWTPLKSSRTSQNFSILPSHQHSQQPSLGSGQIQSKALRTPIPNKSILYQNHKRARPATHQHSLDYSAAPKQHHLVNVRDSQDQRLFTLQDSEALGTIEENPGSEYYATRNREEEERIKQADSEVIVADQQPQLQFGKRQSQCKSQENIFYQNGLHPAQTVTEGGVLTPHYPQDTGTNQNSKPRSKSRSNRSTNRQSSPSDSILNGQLQPPENLRQIYEETLNLTQQSGRTNYSQRGALSKQQQKMNQLSHARSAHGFLNKTSVVPGATRNLPDFSFAESNQFINAGNASYNSKFVSRGAAQLDLQMFNSNFQFKPKINDTSHNLSRSTSVFDSLYNQHSHLRLKKGEKEFSKQNQDFKKFKEECTFRPKINQSKSPGRRSSSNLYERTSAWQEQKNNKISQLKKRLKSPKPSLKPQLNESENSFLKNQWKDHTIKQEGGLQNVVRGSKNHVQKIVQATQMKMLQQEVFLLPSQKKALAKRRNQKPQDVRPQQEQDDGSFMMSQTMDLTGFQKTHQFSKADSYMPKLTPQRDPKKYSNNQSRTSKRTEPKSSIFQDSELDNFDKNQLTQGGEYEHEVRQQLRSDIMSINLHMT